MKTLNIVLALVVMAVCIYIISTSSWFELKPQCPEGTRLIETVWTSNTGSQRTDSICVEGEQ